MPKLKTSKCVTKRFKVTGTGKVMRKGAGHSHLLSGKSAKQRRRSRASVAVTPLQAYGLKTVIHT